MEIKLTIQERLKDLRVSDFGLTLEQLAEKTGLSRSALGKYESDDFTDISPYAIATLAKFYGVSADYLLGLTENKNPANAELQALHLRDDAITSIRDGKYNTPTTLKKTTNTAPVSKKPGPFEHKKYPLVDTW
jgi:transcriptional regulator with XRE-family HTH domain